VSGSKSSNNETVYGESVSSLTGDTTWSELSGPVPPQPDTLRPGEMVDRYVVERPLGSGATAEVYLVRHATLDTHHALKVLSSVSPARRMRLIQEGRIQAGLRHPNIVSVTDVLVIRQRTGLLMEYVAGPSLAGWLEENAPTAEHAEVLFRGLLEGVGAAHAVGIIHRDLKPGNILLDPHSLMPRITDFGLAKHIFEPGVAQTRSGASLGTPAYMAPEQIADASRVDVRADIFSLGCIFYELLCGQRAFRGANVADIFEAIRRSRYTPPAELAPTLPLRHREVIRRCLSADPANRPSSCAEIVQILSDSSDSARPQAPEPAAEIERVVLGVDEDGRCTARYPERGEATHTGPTVEELAALMRTDTSAVRAALGGLRPHPPAILLQLNLPPTLAGLPWESMCAPVARAVPSTRPAVPREVSGTLRILAFSEDPGTIGALPATNPALEWLPPLLGPDARFEALLERLRAPPRPHVLLLDARDGLLQDRQGEPVSAERLAAALDRRLCRELRLIILLAPCQPEVCAELASDGVIAVADWPEPVQHSTKQHQLLALLGVLGDSGDIAAALQAGGAQRLWLRGRHTRLFRYHNRALPSQQPGQGVLQALLSQPGSIVILGERFSSLREEDGRDAVREALGARLPGPARPLPTMLQHYEMQAERGELRALVDTALRAPSPRRAVPAIRSLAAAAGPGLFVSLLWRPLLEEALLAEKPRSRVTVLQPAQPGQLGRLREFRWDPSLGRWQRIARADSDPLDFTRDFVVLRLFGGVGAPLQGLLGEPVLTETDQLRLLSGLHDLPDQLLAAFRQYPVAILGISPELWGHREVMARLTDEHPFVDGSLVALSADASPATHAYWSRHGAPGHNSVQAVLVSP